MSWKYQEATQCGEASGNVNGSYFAKLYQRSCSSLLPRHCRWPHCKYALVVWYHQIFLGWYMDNFCIKIRELWLIGISAKQTLSSESDNDEHEAVHVGTNTFLVIWESDIFLDENMLECLIRILLPFKCSHSISSCTWTYVSRKQIIVANLRMFMKSMAGSVTFKLQQNECPCVTN